jgi:predicted nucleic acid-binding Zn ribbon protein
MLLTALVSVTSALGHPHVDKTASTSEKTLENCCALSISHASNAPVDSDITVYLAEKPFNCEVQGCRAGPYKRRGDLNRHSCTHVLQRVYDCPAVDCSRTGHRGFDRRDKLLDHILARHDEDVLFSCNECGGKLTRDLLAVHSAHSFKVHLGTRYRACPMLRCRMSYLSPSWPVPNTRNFPRPLHARSLS